MKKLIALAAMALTTGAFAADSYLYWMIDDTVTWANGVTAQKYDTVGIAVVDANNSKVSTTYLSLYSDTGTSLGATTLDVSDGGGSLYANLGNYAAEGYSYYIELLNDSSVVGRSSDVLSYSAAKDTYITSFIGGTSVPTNPWSSATFTTAAIPEPTSGLLMLVGLAGLALRRKRQQMA